MREVKFRAWDKEHYKMHQVEEIDFIGEELKLCDAYDIEEYMHWSFLELMQYTGLKDTNGKEIYEGDIIRSRYPAYNDEPERDYIYYVGFEMGGYYLKTKGSSFSHGLGYEITKAMNPKIEVIGNIYENPELMEVQDVEVDKR